MKEKIKEIISLLVIALFITTLLFEWLTEEPQGHYEQYTSKADSETHYIYVEE